VSAAGGSGIQSGLIFDHLRSMSDQHGLFEHALYAIPRPEHGYCLDDVARGLVVVCREPRPGPAVLRLCQLYLDFTLAALQPDGSCHNRMNVAGDWTDAPALGDWWGRALWGLGVAAAHAPTEAIRARALLGFRTGARQRSQHLHAMSFAALGAGELLLSRPDEPAAQQLLRDALASIGRPRPDPDWPWPQDRLAYGSGAIVEALLLVGQALPDPQAQADGLLLLDFLLDTETRDGHLSVTPVGGRAAGRPALVFDQQPIEVAALADACARAHTSTGDQRWLDGVRLAWQWFLGDNDSATPMIDLRTGAGFDGLQSTGCNLNQGAESTLAALSTAQHARRLGLLHE
jgi:hypothetical protein